MKLLPLERRSHLYREEFIESYLKPKRPVVFTDLVEDWPALDKWTFDWLRKNYGHIQVPLFDNHIHDTKKYFQTAKTMPFGEYLTLIERGPTDLRIFLFDILRLFQNWPIIFVFRQLMDGFLKSYKFMFFCGQNSVVNLHYDMDCSNVFLTQFQTRKQAILFSPEQSVNLYQHPFTVQSHVNPLNPEYELYPAMKNLEGYEVTFGHGETLFIPSLWWHYIKYVDGGFSLALRANDSIFTTARGGWNVVRHTFIDKGITKLAGDSWKKWKECKSVKIANKVLETA